ncbi:DUF2007 domain-containing protein [Flavobacterium sp. GSP27]|uniref:DUF2007 domain-containing protein n=1 Tax=Flavobacterium bomense TaxID=2497483 RepID=A0A432CR38_9FLAO|nr:MULTISPECIES: DUF2007 domain-containing protein [Flavobacterium]RTY70375.1 DUF2007 domain-containing protein [Flavobacterium sp. LB2P53]RTY76333.1 DUF2007 domain-containing protein [Flavobacterium sp. LS1R10]RTY81280.1 DUF2007 domain-containing protein [Flavobacterium sp. ZB4P23]RTY85228.1 DUF2007 domain-containing protein [Flavobacterium sp. LS1P28]RTY88290.1 DUF2007 domain-containing protein [Flavobacterium sp. RSP15]
MEDFKIIRTFNYSHEIVVLKHLLEQEKINYFFENETLVSIDPFGSFAYGGIKLKVHINDFEKVQELLDNLNTKLTIV